MNGSLKEGGNFNFIKRGYPEKRGRGFPQKRGMPTLEETMLVKFQVSVNYNFGLGGTSSVRREISKMSNFENV